ncbi:MAG: glycosyltransferase family 2 protein [Actinobacteria bacterium]|nr:glycosyltransferase family 2 protein [Actinomycetota bacterium]
MSESVAVVIPTFNSASTIERALASVVCQTRLPDEVIVVDNASADDTISRVRAFAARHQKVIWQIETLPVNIGPGAARNRGWDLAKSDLIAFLDSDDSWRPEKLEMQCEVVHKFSDSVLFGHSYVVVRQDEDTPRSIGATPVIDHVGLRHFLLRNRLSTPTVMLRRTIPERFPTDVWHAEDAIFQRCALTLLHKSTYGESGLSANMTKMHQGELYAARRLMKTHDIGVLGRVLIMFWLKVKYLRRRIVMLCRD